MKIDALLNYWCDIADLTSTAKVLYWDQKTQMPRSGNQARSHQSALIQKLIHERMTSPEFAKILNDLQPLAAQLDFHSVEAGMIRAAQRAYDKATKLPKELVQAKAKASAEGYMAWVKAREAEDFQLFVPALKRNIELAKQTAEALGYQDHPMDALVNQSEPGFNTKEIEHIFQELRTFLVPLVQQIASQQDEEINKLLTKEFEPDQQWKLGQAAVRQIGFKLHEGRCDPSLHPFSISFTPQDTRITSRIKRFDFKPCFFGFLHEAGHGQYMQGIPVEYSRTPIMDGISAGMHESQSRMWENNVGRSRTFTNFFYPVIKAYFPEQTRNVTVEDWYRAINGVQPSFIRVEADEVTYNLHIMIRFEIEKGVLEGKYQVEDLEQIWNKKFEEYLGIVPPCPTQGVLQDIHWSGSFGGSFQGYTLGNVMAAQLYEAAVEQKPDLTDAFKNGDYSELLTWTRRNLHDYGCMYTPQELMVKTTGSKLKTDAYFRYIKGKYSELYNLK